LLLPKNFTKSLAALCWPTPYERHQRVDVNDDSVIRQHGLSSGRPPDVKNAVTEHPIRQPVQRSGLILRGFPQVFEVRMASLDERASSGDTAELVVSLETSARQVRRGHCR